MQVRIFKPAKTAMQSGTRQYPRVGAGAGAVAQGDRPVDGLDQLAQHDAAGPPVLPDAGRSEGPCREERLAVHGRAAAQPAGEGQGLRRQFRLHSRRSLDALMSMPARMELERQAPVAQGIRATAF